MKILFITTTSTTSYAFLIELADELRKSNNEVEFAFNSDSFSDAPSKKNEIIDRGFVVNEVKFNRDISLIQDIKSGIKLFKLIKANKYDIVHSHTSKAGFISRIVCKVIGQYNIHTSHDLYYRAFKKGVKRKIFIYIERFASCFADKIFFVSEAVMDSAIKEKVASSDKLYFVSNGIIPKNNYVINNENIKTNPHLFKNEGKKVVGVVSRLVKNKAVDVFIKTAIEIEKEDPFVKFIIIGKGPLLKRLKEQGRDLVKKDKLFFLNNIETKKDLENIVSTFDVFLFPTIREGLGIVILEALDLGVPVITTNLAPMNTIITNKVNGFLCEKSNHHDFAKKTIQVLSDYALRGEMIENGYKTVNEKFNLDVINKNIIKIYHHSIEK